MARSVDWSTGDAASGGQLSPRVRRALRRGPRNRVIIRPVKDRPDDVAVPGVDERGPAGTLHEWHDMTPGQLVAEWAGLRAWVRWLTGRYELTVEDRLPPCWLLHPGLVEELYALRAWRAEIYSSGEASTGQAARYWHAELRAVIQAATTVYAAGCRTGHRGAAELAGVRRDLLEEWGGGYPLAGVPELDVAAGQAYGSDGWASQEEIALALDDGDAVPIPGSELVLKDGRRWAAAAGGWVEVPSLDVTSGGSPDSRGDRPWTS